MRIFVLLALSFPIVGHAMEENLWFLTEGKPRGVVLVTHGLNQKPSAMNSVSQTLQAEGYSVLRLALPGHRGNIEEMKSITIEQWLDATLDGYREARLEATKYKVPLFLVGYSMGALVAEYLMNIEKSVTFDRAVLFAPAVAIRTRSKLIKATFVLDKGFLLPSKSPQEYRANPKTPVAAYEALFAGLAGLNKSGFKSSNIPTLVFVDDHDELVSAKGLRKVKEKYDLTHWTVVSVAKQNPALTKNFKHLITDARAVGEATWVAMKSAMLEHLSSAACGGAIRGQ